MDYVGAIIGVLGTILGGVLSYAAFHRNSKKDSEEEGKSSGTMLTEIGYIAASTVSSASRTHRTRAISAWRSVCRRWRARQSRRIIVRQARGARGAGGRIMSARKGAARRRKFKKWALEVWSFAKGYLSFSKLLVYAVLYIDYKSTMTTLDLCRISVANNYTGSLPYLTALIAFLQAATATVLSFSLNKSKAENTTGGITYDTATKRDC